MSPRSVRIIFSLMLLISVLALSTVGVLAKEKLTVWAVKHFVEGVNQYMQQSAQLFGDRYNVEVELVLIPWADIYPKWMAAIEANNLPDMILQL